MARRTSMLLLFMLAPPAVFLLGCGYSISSRADGARSDLRSASEEPARPIQLHVSSVQNQLVPPRPGLEYELTKALKDELVHDRRFELAPAANWDVRLDVTLLRYQEPDLVRDLQDRATERAVIVNAQILVTQRDGQSRTLHTFGRSNYAPVQGESLQEAKSRTWRELSGNILDRIDGIGWPKSPDATR